jgi:periplasmic divalent cation tolerance protein
LSDVALLRVTFADAGEAERIGRAMVEARLAACVNLAPCRSIYRWQGAVESAEEVAALFKTSLALAPALRDRIAALHSYDLPAIEIWPAAVDAALADWIAGSTKG